MADIWLVILLGISGYLDKKSGRVWIPLAAAGFLARIPLFFLGDGWSAAYLLGFLPGLFLLLIARITGGAVGYGDGLMMLVCGWYVGIGEAVLLLLGSLLLCSVWSIGLIALRRVKREYRIAYLPFLFAADVCRMIMERAG